MKSTTQEVDQRQWATHSPESRLDSSFTPWAPATDIISKNTGREESMVPFFLERERERESMVRAWNYACCKWDIVFSLKERERPRGREREVKGLGLRDLHGSFMPTFTSERPGEAMGVTDQADRCWTLGMSSQMKHWVIPISLSARGHIRTTAASILDQAGPINSGINAEHVVTTG